VRGLPALLQAVSDHVHRYLGLRYDPGHILVGPGSKELMFLTQMALDADVLLPSPAWVSYAPQARIAGRSVTWLPTRREDRWHLDPDLLHRTLQGAPPRARVLVLNYPNNPNGATMPPDRLERIAAVARAHGLLILADEIYGLVDNQGSHRSIAHYYPEGTLVSTGMSKWCGAGGWRLGTLLVPRELGWFADVLATLAGETYSCVSAPIQHAAVVAYRGGPEIDAYLKGIRRILSALGRRVARSLAETGFDLDPPDGGFYVFPDAGPLARQLKARGITTAIAFCERALSEAGVALLPGVVFGRPEEEITFRLSYVDFDGGNALEANALIPDRSPLDDGFLRAHCPRVLAGVERLGAWAADSG
jgi:aspartate aminotransferase